jgi:hypothetical protein
LLFLQRPANGTPWTAGIPKKATIYEVYTTNFGVFLIWGGIGEGGNRKEKLC